MILRTVLFVTAVLGILCIPPGLTASVWYVDTSVTDSGDGTSWEDAFKTIQEGIDAASDGDDVVVAEGTYPENIRFKGKNIVLRSNDPLDESVVENTVIDGGKKGPVVEFAGTETENCLLSGFTIHNGRAQIGGGILGGTQGNRAHATILNNTITDNQATGTGGGGVAFCDGLIDNNTVSGNSNTASTNDGGGFYYCGGTIQKNTISGNSAGGGGGLYNCDGTIQNNVIIGNWVSVGGGLRACDGTIQDNEIKSNSARFSGGGLHECQGAILTNTISGNSAGQGGGGLADCKGTVQNNLISDNSANWGGGLDYCEGTFQNNTICHNSADKGGGGLARCVGTIRNCIIWGNTSPNGSQLYESSFPTYSCVQDWAGDGVGNIKEDPLFIDAAGGDYHLQTESPCIDAGVDFYWFLWPQRDLDRNSRLAGKRVDIGCYEYGSSPDSDGDLLSDERESTIQTDPNVDDTDGDGLGDGLEVLRGSDPDQATTFGVISVPSQQKTVQGALCLAINGEEIIVAPGTYFENIDFGGKNVILRSSDPLDPAIVASTIIDGSQSGPVVAFSGPESRECVLSGFTIRNGKAIYRGGGVQGCGVQTGGGMETHATIESNVITGNSTEKEGGGLNRCSGSIQNNTIVGNMAVGDLPNGNGGGLANCSSIYNNVITGNSAVGGGGGLYLCMHVRNNTISGNSALGGGGLCSCYGFIQGNIIAANSAAMGAGVAYSTNKIFNNLIVANSADDRGGGIEACDAAIFNNTIVGNSAVNSGGGLSNCAGETRNCVVWGNTSPESPQFHESSLPTSSCIQDWSGGGEGNTADDPEFADPDGPDNDPITYNDNNYRLAAGSPCIDAGQNEIWLSWSLDLDGNPRTFFGRSSLTVDMGAYEYNSFLFRIITVNKEPAGGTEIVWTSRPTDTYVVWSCLGLMSPAWTEEATVPSQGESTPWTDPDIPSIHKFYRVELQ